MYGFAPSEKLYLQIFLYNPNILQKIVDLLRSGSILGTEFRVFEAHLPYIMKLFIDYNLYGMSTLKLSKATFRKLPTSHKKIIWNEKEIEMKMNSGTKYFLSESNSNYEDR
jgi:DNA polymerase zeta